MELTIFWSDKIKMSPELREHYQKFCQQMANALAVGHAQYGHPSVEQKYMKRAELELHNYKSTGNALKLRDLANYCLLESLCPQNKKFHFDATAESSSRKAMRRTVGKSKGQKEWGRVSRGEEDY